MTAVGVAIAALSFGVGYVCQLLVNATPYDGDPRSLSKTHNIYTVAELEAMMDTKKQVDAYQEGRADLHDVLQVTLKTRDIGAARLALKERNDLKLLRQAIDEKYPVPADNQTPAPAPAPVPVPAPSATPAFSYENINGRQTAVLGGGGSSNSNSDQTIPAANVSTDAPRLQLGGGGQPPVDSLAPAHIAVGQ
jgi:hypothetical protein